MAYFEQDTMKRYCTLLFLVLVGQCLQPAQAVTNDRRDLSELNRVIDLPVQLDAQAVAWLKEKKNLTVGVTFPDYPPFTITDSSNKLQGITAEYLTGLQSALQVNINIRRFASREQAFAELRNGGIDMVDTSTKAEANKYSADLTNGYAFTRIALYSKSGSLLNLDLSMPDLKISTTQGGLVSDEILNTFRNATIVKYASPLEAISSISSGDAQVYLGDTVTTSYLANQSFGNQLVTNLMVEGAEEPIGFAIRPQDVELKRIIDLSFATQRPCQQSDTIEWWVHTIRCAGSDFQKLLSKDEKQLVDSNKTFTIAISEDMAPYAFFDMKEQFSGSMSDILELVRLESGLKFKVMRSHSSASAIHELDSKQVDLSLLVQTEGTQYPYLLTHPIFSTPYTFISRADQPTVSALNLDASKIIAIPESDPLITYIQKNHPQVKIILTDTIADSFNKVRDGSANFTITSINQARYYLSYKYENSLKIAGFFSPLTANMTIAANLDNALLISVVKKSLARISPNEISMISGRWRANSATDKLYWEGINIRTYQILSALFILLLITGIWIVFLRKTIFKRSIERKNLQTRLALKQNMVNSIPHPISVRDRNGALALFNTSYVRSFISNADEAINSEILDGAVSPTMFKKWQAHYADVVRTGSAISFDQTLPTPNGNLEIYHWIEPLRDQDEKVIGVVSGWLDIGNRLQILEELRQAKDAADKANNSKSFFLATMSHEIRTPMNAIIGMLELALTRDHSDIKNRDAIAVAHSSALGLLELLGSILDVSSIESGHTQLHLEPTTWRKALEPVVNIFQGPARQKNLSVSFDLGGYGDIAVLMDKLKIRQILSNLLSNAIKFTKVGKVSVVLDCKSNAGTFNFVLRVKDTGTGIAEEEKAALFTPFQRTTVNPNSGAGLGLSICKSLSEIIGGDLEVTSVLGEGTCVSVSLSAQPSELGISATKEPPTVIKRATSLRILIAEDHLPSLTLLKEQLELLGHTPIISHNGLEALFSWEDTEIDMLITDCNMPELSGMGLTTEIRNREKSIGVRPCTIIGLTASARKVDISECIDAGMNHCLIKPVSIAQLKNFVPDLREQQRSASDPLTPSNFLLNLPDHKKNAMLQELISTNRSDYRALSDAFESEDVNKMHDTLHRLKSSAGIMNSSELRAICESLDSALKSPMDKPIIANELVELDRILTNLHNVLLEQSDFN